MAIIIDTNCFSNVFSRSSIKHKEFEPVLNWIINGKGIMIYGGTKYKEELRKAPKYLRLINLLKELGKVYIGADEEIDEYQSIIEKLRDNSDFDDPHLPAIVIVTKCRIICTEDIRSIPYVTDRKYYPKNYDLPVYYTTSKNKNLLSDKYVDKTLKPLCKLNKKQIKVFENFKV